MAKIDISKIEGYAAMTPEQKIAALEAAETPDADYTGYVKKETFDKTASELATLKKQHRDTLSAEEQKKQEDEQALADMKNQLETLKKDKTVSEYKAKFIAQGYKEDLAEETAKALADGDTAKVFANQTKFLDDYAKNVKADALKKTPKPPAGDNADDADYKKKIEEAQTNGDLAAAAYYTRLQAQEEAQTKE